MINFLKIAFVFSQKRQFFRQIFRRKYLNNHNIGPCFAEYQDFEKKIFLGRKVCRSRRDVHEKNKKKMNQNETAVKRGKFLSIKYELFTPKFIRIGSPKTAMLVTCKVITNGLRVNS
jgi:hypothetical protein